MDTQMHVLVLKFHENGKCNVLHDGLHPTYDHFLKLCKRKKWGDDRWGKRYFVVRWWDDAPQWVRIEIRGRCVSEDWMERDYIEMQLDDMQTFMDEIRKANEAVK
ncbi:MAG: hypothetical protein ACXQS4_02525 [Methermicoccaceae archaeon]